MGIDGSSIKKKKEKQKTVSQSNSRTIPESYSRRSGPKRFAFKLIFTGVFFSMGFLFVYLFAKSHLNLNDDKKHFPTEKMANEAAEKRVESTLSSLDEVVISDVNLRQCITRTAEDWANASGSRVADITQLTRLSCEDMSISSIAGISALTGLTFLDLSYNNISDIYELHNLQSLKTLWLTDNPISTISAFQQMGNLTNVKLPDMVHFYCYELLEGTRGKKTNIKNIECKGKWGYDINPIISQQARGEDLTIEQQERLEEFRYNEQMMNDHNLTMH